MDRETWKLMFGDTPMPGDTEAPADTVQWSPNGVANLGPGIAAGENLAANPASWVQRGDYRVNNQTAEAQKLNNGAWENLGFSPYTNEALQNSYGFMKAPDGTDPSQYQSWALQNGWKEPSRNSGMTLGEALLMMGGAAMGAGALNGLGAGNDVAALMDMNAGASGAGAASSAAGGGAMDWTDVLGDFVSGGTEYAPQNVVDLFNNAGMPGYSNYGQSLEELAAQLFDNAGMPGYTQTGDPATGLDWLKSQFGGPNSLLNSIKSLGGTGASAGSGTGTGGNSLLGTALGGLLGSLNGSKQAGTTTVTQEPWSEQKPFLLDAFAKAKAASGGSPLQTQANTNYSSVLSGPTTNPMLGMDNPYLTSAINNANADVTRAFMPAVNQANRASGSFGNSGVADTYGKNMADAYSRNATTMRMQDYTNQQNLQQQAVNNTLGFTSNANNFAAQPSQNYAQTVQGNYGGQTTTPYYNNPLSGIMGGAMVGNSIGSNLGF